MRLPLLFRPAACLLAALTFSSAFAQIPTWSVVNTGLDATFGDAGKGVLAPKTSGFTGIAFGNGLFVALGASYNEDVIRWATSPDGLVWTGRSQVIGAGSTSYSESGVHFQNGKFVFFAAHSVSGVARTFVYSSTDGLTWTSSTVVDGRPGFSEFDSTGGVTVLASHNGAQFASPNLTTWNSSPVVAGGSGYDHLDVAAGNGKFISSINGFGGKFYTSSDAATWTPLSTAAVIGGGFVEFGNGMFILKGDNLYRSTDLVSFTKLTAVVAPSNWYPPGGAPRFINNLFVAPTVDLNNGGLGYVSSTDGEHYTPLGYYPNAPASVAGTNRSYYHADIAYGNGRYVIAGFDRTATFSGDTYLPLIIAGVGYDAPQPPVITTQPQPSNAVIGGSATFSAGAIGTGFTYQWYFNNVAIAGATSATYTISVVSSGNAGSYKVSITNASGTTFSNIVTLTLVSASNAGRIVNLSVRSSAGTGAQTLIVGVVVGGSGVSGSKQALVRAIGPTLTGYGVGGALVDPIMTLYQGTTIVAANDNWAGDSQIIAIANQVGAFALPSTTSKDAAFYSPAVNAGIYSVQITGANSSTGVALAEIYDATPNSSFTATTPRLINVSARTQVGTGDQILIAGFVVGGSTSRSVLIRGIGPTLTGYGVGGALADPKLELYQGTTLIAQNDNWAGTTALSTAFTATGAFALDPTSKDAAILVTLPPGVYSAQVSGVGGTTGIGLVEVYEAP